MGSTKDLQEAVKVGIGGDDVCALSASTQELPIAAPFIHSPQPN